MVKPVSVAIVYGLGILGAEFSPGFIRLFLNAPRPCGGQVSGYALASR